MRKLMPLILGLVGLSAGVGAGYVLRPAPAAEAPAHDAQAVEGDGTESAKVACPTTEPPAAETPHEGESDTEFVKLNNQFVVPVVEQGQIAAMVILSLSLEVPRGDGPRVFEYEPKLRDTILQTLFNHANAGGFRGSFTEPDAMETLRKALLETARRVLGHSVTSVLITDIVRQ